MYADAEWLYKSKDDDRLWHEAVEQFASVKVEAELDKLFGVEGSEMVGILKVKIGRLYPIGREALLTAIITESRASAMSNIP